MGQGIMTFYALPSGGKPCLSHLLLLCMFELTWGFRSCEIRGHGNIGCFTSELYCDMNFPQDRFGVFGQRSDCDRCVQISMQSSQGAIRAFIGDWTVSALLSREDVLRAWLRCPGLTYCGCGAEATVYVSKILPGFPN